MSNPEGKSTVYADDRPSFEPLTTSEKDPGLGRHGGTMESERAATGESSDESAEMPVIDSNPYRPR